MSPTPPNDQPEVSTAVPPETIIQTHHTITLNGQELAYTATTGALTLMEEIEKEDKSEGEKARATIYFVAYTKDGAEPGQAEPGQRPITFAFNGGPGSSSVWLHLGLLGPKRVLTEADGSPTPPPYRLVDNEYSLLDKSDLVFIDPVSTGFSRVVPGEKPKEFHGFKKDIASVGDFIRLYTTRYGRWLSPKFLAGESYGTTRAAGLSGYLQERHGMYLNGIFLISSILNFQTAYFKPGNDLPYALFLPTYAATAWFHGRLVPELQANLAHTLAEVEEFALGEYTLALMQGAALSAENRTAVAQKLARYTGLTTEYIERTDLRINIHRFCKELLRDQGRTTGRLDSRFTGVDRDSAGETNEFDPSYAAIQGPYTATLNDYVRRELQFESDLPYEILTGRVQPWDYGDHQNAFVDVAETLRKAISFNPHLKVFIANGYYDLATPYLATRYTVNHLGLTADLYANIHLTFYEAGHMMYLHRPSLAQLKLDMAEWLETAVSRP